MEKGEIRFHGPDRRAARPARRAALGVPRGRRVGRVGRTGRRAAARGRGRRRDRRRGGRRDRRGRGRAIETEQPEPRRRPTRPLRGRPGHPRAVSRSFGGIRAVDDVTLAVAPGEIVGIIGPNGAGKTTLFDLISGFTPGRRRPRSSSAASTSPSVPAHRRALRGPRPLVPGRPPLPRPHRRGDHRRRPRAVDRRARPAAAPRSTCPPSFDSEEEVRERVDELIDLLGLGAFRSKFVRELSTGSRRVVDLACVVAHRPTVVLLDEPSSGIAQRETEALGPAAAPHPRAARRRRSCVIEHDMPLVTAVSDRLVAMDQGAVIADGPAERGAARPAGRVVLPRHHRRGHRPVREAPGPRSQLVQLPEVPPMLPSSDQPTNDRSRQLKRYGPLAVIAVIAIVILVVVVVAGGGDDDPRGRHGRRRQHDRAVGWPRGCGHLRRGRRRPGPSTTTRSRTATPRRAGSRCPSTSCSSATPTSSDNGGETARRRHRGHHQGRRLRRPGGRPGHQLHHAGDQQRRHERPGQGHVPGLRRHVQRDVPDLRPARWSSSSSTPRAAPRTRRRPGPTRCGPTRTSARSRCGAGPC